MLHTSIFSFSRNVFQKLSFSGSFNVLIVWCKVNILYESILGKEIRASACHLSRFHGDNAYKSLTKYSINSLSLTKSKCLLQWRDAPLILEVVTMVVYQMACNMRKGTFERFRIVSFQISLRSPHRLIWNDNFRFMPIFSVYRKSTVAQNLME